MVHTRDLTSSAGIVEQLKPAETFAGLRDAVCYAPAKPFKVATSRTGLFCRRGFMPCNIFERYPCCRETGCSRLSMFLCEGSESARSFVTQLVIISWAPFTYQAAL